MRIETDPKLDFSDVLLCPKRSTLSSRSEVDLLRDYTFLHSKKNYCGVPIIASNMDTIGTLSMAETLTAESMSVALHKHINNSEIWNWFNKKNGFDEPVIGTSSVFYSMGITDKDLKRYLEFKTSMSSVVDSVCIDVANGYSESFIDFVRQFRLDNPRTTIMAGNVVTPEVTEQLILAGADIVKVGIGSGSVCTTRRMTGVGYPQLSAIIECADAAHGLSGHICSDGGCTVPGDVAKAFAAGADFVMLGGMLAGHDECGGEIVESIGSEKMKFYGMSSKEAQNKHNGGVAEYRAAEGKCVEVPYRGPVINTIREILGGVRSACTYVGACKLKELSKRATFVLVNRQLNTVFGD